ncbi:MAG: hypothetical protein KGM95_04860 [Betaproteobacteria bacterium]|nr:hypothetical protein [Betaproteobacteria bacterium]
MPAPAVCDRFEQLVDFGFMWAAGQTTVATTYSTGQYFQGEIMTTPISCYELPLWCAQQTGVPSNVIWGVIDDLFRASAQRNAPNQNSILGALKRYFFNTLAPLRLFGSYPQKGDLVLFSGGTTNYLAHVAMATGNGYELVSFGHDGPLGAPAAGVALQVERMTINDVLTRNPMLTRVEFGTPPW